MSQKIEFDDSRALMYRKQAEILAFRSDAPIIFDKSWGKQRVRKGGWIIVPLSDSGKPIDDIYGCDADVFASTYEPSPSLRPNQYRKKETVRAYKPGIPFEVEVVLSDGHVEVKKSFGDSYDTWIVRAPGGEIYPVADKEFKRTYIQVVEPAKGYRKKTRDEHWKADGTPKRILALDGGGVRGILTLGFLERIESLLRKRHGGGEGFRFSHYFDMIAGTSTGSIIAAGLAKGMKVVEVRECYDALAGSVFRRSFFRKGKLRARYSANKLIEVLKIVFKNNTMGSTSIETGLLVVAKRLDTGSVWPMSNNPGNRFFKAGPYDKFLPNEDYPLLSVVRASTAAPSYFIPEHIEISPEGDNPNGIFVDGGVSPHNNPALLALQLATTKGFGAEWPLDPDKLLLVSVGTGTAQPGYAESWLAAKHAINSLLSLTDDCAKSVEVMLQWLSDSPTARRIDAAFNDLGPDLLAERPLLRYLRYNVRLESKWLKENLGKEISEAKMRELKEMDHPENMSLLSELGVLAASQQVKENHFPKSFDLTQ